MQASTSEQLQAVWNRRAVPEWTKEPPTEPGLYYYYQPLYEPDPTVMTIYYDRKGNLTCREMRVSLDDCDMAFPHALWSKTKITLPPQPPKAKGETNE